MSPQIAERAFEDAIECGLLRHGPDACSRDATAIGDAAALYGESPPVGGPSG